MQWLLILLVMAGIGVVAWSVMRKAPVTAAPPAFDPWVYDTDGDGKISMSEFLKAANDRNMGKITEEQFGQVERLYMEGQTLVPPPGEELPPEQPAPYPCPYCGKTFDKETELKLHILSEHLEEPSKELISGPDDPPFEDVDIKAIEPDVWPPQEVSVVWQNNTLSEITTQLNLFVYQGYGVAGGRIANGANRVSAAPAKDRATITVPITYDYKGMPNYQIIATMLDYTTGRVVDSKIRQF